MTKLNADTVDAFIEAANKKFGGSDVGETKAHPAFSYSFKGGKLTKVNFTCPITLDFAEVGGGKPNAANKDAIAKVAQLAEDHEEKHKAGYESAFKTFDPDKTAKELMAKTFKDEKEAKKELEAKFKALKDALMQACLDLHKSEGIIEVTTNINIQMKPAGASGCR